MGNYDGDSNVRSEALATFIIAGFIIPLGFIAYSIYILLDPVVTLIGKHGQKLILRHDNAILFAVELILIGAFLHIHLIWLVDNWLRYLVNALEVAIVGGFIVIALLIFFGVVFK